MGQITLTATADVYIDSEFPTTNRNSNAFISVGEPNNFSAVHRGLLKFNLSTLVYATIQSATLRMCVTGDRSDNVRNESVYRLLREWVETEATWNIAKTGTNWGTAGAGNTTSDYNSTALGVTSVAASPTIGTWIEWSLSAAEIEKLAHGTYTNYGFLVRAATENADNILYSSREGANPPQLVVEYTSPFIPQVIWF